MTLSSRLFSAVCTLFLLVGGSAVLAAQQSAVLSPSAAAADSSSVAGLPNAPGASQEPPGQKEKNPNTTDRAANKAVPPSKEQPKRILGIMPNYRAVSAGAIPPPPTARQSFAMAAQNSFDYSAFAFVALTSMIAEGEDAHPKLGKGIPGLWAYSWRGFVDKTDGNYLVMWALPSVLHEDERYYTLGQGTIMKRAVYASTRIFITPDYHGHNTVNASELLGRGIAQAISTTYYPSSDNTPGSLTQKYAYALLRDAGTNVFREFWPDIAGHFSHRHSKATSYNLETGAEVRGN